MQNNKLRNVAIIAHVDHGKTTLVDEMLKQGGVYRENQEVVDRVMDSNDLERERGITILAKNTAIHYKAIPRSTSSTRRATPTSAARWSVSSRWSTASSCWWTPPRAPCRRRALCFPKCAGAGPPRDRGRQQDRPPRPAHPRGRGRGARAAARPRRHATSSLTAPCSSAPAETVRRSYSPDAPGTDLKPLFDTILNYIPAPEADVDQPFQMLVSAIDYNEFVGRMAIGRIERGTLKQNQEIMVCNYHNPDAAPKKAKAVSLYEFDGLGKKPVTESTAGNIICLSGIGDITIGDTICAPECVEPLPFVKISAPTMEMTFSINDSPFAGRDGKFVTSRQLRERLFRETLKDVSLRVTEIEGAMDAFNVAGRGEMSPVHPHRDHAPRGL